jgi:hypothetical protein
MLGPSALSSVLSPHVRRRAAQEAWLAREQAGALLGATVALLYGCMMVFRNLAFYAYEPGDGKRLQDLGFELVVDWEEATWATAGDVPIWVITAWLLALLVSSFRAPRAGAVPKPFAVNIVLRYVLMLALGHTLRFATYISTVYPGTSKQCLGDVSAIKPQSLLEVFVTRFEMQPGMNCGDLLFSGHVLQMSIPVLLISKYGRVIFEWSDLVHCCSLALLWGLVLAMAVAIVARRHHYTQDVVLAGYLTPLLWHFFDREIKPDDKVPPENLPDRPQAGEGGWAALPSPARH